MKSQDLRGESRLAIEIEPELRQRIEAAATERGIALRDYVIARFVRRCITSTPNVR